MQIRDLNASGDTSVAAGSAMRGANAASGTAAQVGGETAELAFLRARVEHLEIVIETARGLMTSNQERLLRRLHDMPREMATLAARVDAPARESLWGHN